MIKDIIFNRTLVIYGAALASITALTAALISQYVYGLYPCILCLYQRVPYGLIIAFAVLYFFLKNKAIRSALYIASALAFFINSAIAFFHAGVEQLWWKGTDSCTTSFPSGADLDTIRNAIMNAPIARCDEIPFELFGLSMAAYNVIFCLALGCAMTFIYIKTAGRS